MTATTETNPETNFRLTLMIYGLTLLALLLEMFSSYYLADGSIFIFIVIVLFIALTNGGQILTTTLTQEYKSIPQAKFATLILTALLTLINAGFLFMALESKLEVDKLAKVRNNPVMQQALLEYETAKTDYENTLASTNKSTSQLQTEIAQARNIDNQISALKDQAQSQFNIKNEQWNQDFNSYISNTTYSWANGNEVRTYSQIAQINYSNGHFTCVANVANARGEKFITPAKAVCQKLNSSYPKPQSMALFIDQQKLNSLQAELSKYTDAQSALWRIERAKNMMAQKQEQLLQLENSLSTDDISWDLIERIANMTNQSLAYIETLALILCSTMLHSLRNSFVWLQSVGGSSVKESKKQEYFHKILTAILTHNRDVNIGLLVAVTVIISFATGFLIQGYFLAVIFAIIVGIISYLGLSYYPVGDNVIKTMGDLKVTTPYFSDLKSELEKAAQNVTKSLGNVTHKDNVTKRSDNKVTPKKTSENVTERYNNPSVTSVSPNNFGFENVTMPFSFAGLPTAASSAIIGDNVTVSNQEPVKPKTVIRQQAGFTGVTTVVPTFNEIKELYPEWVELREAGKTQTGALRELEKRYGLPANSITNGQGTRWKRIYNAKKEKENES